MNIHIHHHYSDKLNSALDYIIHLIKTNNLKLTEMSQELDNLTQEVSEEVTVMASAVVLINGLATQVAEIKAQLAAQGIDNTKLNDLSQSLNTSGDALAAAVQANTPSA
jgi:cell division GTPase FtsZ